ncbi:hypothetical protein NE237_014101 [Protea cynaroides]|uniref:PP2A regulatory subunit TAP46 n=1 Tax=Protea cynaroides TaxID=273540 RepID=A0A9Q0K0S3_9MAGN|nr:hypothetical protein NE237_014101 [Protea cynaroides]
MYAKFPISHQNFLLLWFVPSWGNFFGGTPERIDCSMVSGNDHMIRVSIEPSITDSGMEAIVQGEAVRPSIVSTMDDEVIPATSQRRTSQFSIRRPLPERTRECLDVNEYYKASIDFQDIVSLCVCLFYVIAPSMGEWEMEEMPLPTLFELGRKIHNMASESGVDQGTLRKGYEALQQCEEMISQLGMFSANETKDDISTTNLKYLLVPFYLGELMEKVAQEDRIQVLKISRARLKEFISFCELMELVPEEELQSYAQEGPASLTDRRAKKIARFKRQQGAESKLQEIKERRERRGRSSKASALSNPIEAGEEDVLDDDREEEREAWLTTISLALCKAFDLLEMLKKEEEMLSAVKENQLQEDKEIARDILDERTKRAEAWHHDAALRAQFTKPAQPITCAAFAQDVIEGRAMVSQAHEHKHQPLVFGPASLVGGSSTSERERMAAQLFQPGFSLPTMSIEAAGLREMEMMKKWQERNAKEVNSSWHQEGWESGPTSEDDDDNDDDAVEKARAWDDWKDDHPRGAGNKKLTPCG